MMTANREDVEEIAISWIWALSHGADDAAADAGDQDAG